MARNIPTEGMLVALLEELEQARRNKPGGQPPRPDRIAAIEQQIRRARIMLGLEQVETAVAAEPVEVTVPKRGPGRPRKTPAE